MAHRALDLFIGLLALAGFGLGGDHEAGDLGIAAARGMDGHVHGVIHAVFAEESALGFGVGANHGVLGAVHHEGVAHGVPIGKQRLGHVGADDGGVRAALVLFGSEEAAVVEVARRNLIRIGTEEGTVVGV